ncbi:MAG: hypothetical protein R6U50_13345 [Desulfobacterales bacterium]
MASEHTTDFSKKHPADKKPDSAVASEIQRRVKNNEIPCAVAFAIAEKTGVSPKEVGIALDLLNIRLTKCQLGLFGYKDRKKIIHPDENVDRNVADAIRSAAGDSRLSCREAWRIASERKVSKIAVSSACETLGIKIKPCQLGAF